ncbi:MAG: hypothetical protein KTR15_10175 [Phycisphaeraceae bacterium]|nr:hypothetical protein [Phycisphaeraceae bacterium]
MLDRYDQDLLLDYLEGELDADRRAQLDAMLAEDPQLAALLEEMGRDRAALRSLPHAEAPGDLVHDVTQTLERRMLLDEPVDDTTPIPISRAMAGEPTRSISWGRVVGLTGLAASVALAAGILVITLDDTLQQTANEFADNTGADAEEETAETADADEAAGDFDRPEGVAALDQPDGTSGLPTPGITTPPADPAGAELASGIEEAFADRGERALFPDSTPGTGLAARIGEGGAGDQPIESFAFGSTAAISVIQPRQQLVLLSESPEVSLEQLLDFCVDNGIPVVQPDQQANPAQPRKPQAAPDPGLVASNTPADTDESYADYALLINEEQLDTLVQSLNNNVTLDPKRVDKGSLFSNQAALVEDLPEDAYRHRVPDLGQAAVTDDTATPDTQEKAFESGAFVEQQAIQLRSPDLGSAYANTRNAYNLLNQQQGGYTQKEQPLANVEPPATQAPKPAESDTSPEPQPELIEADQATSESEAARALTPAEDAGDEDAEFGDTLNEDADNNGAQRLSRHIDPSRGNWLSAHLPLADTTPLLLSWRQGQADRPTKLVPVMIQRAEPEKVNTLRMRQQNEYANRSNGTTAEAEPSVETEPLEDQPAEAEAPAQAQPTEPAE